MQIYHKTIKLINSIQSTDMNTSLATNKTAHTETPARMAITYMGVHLLEYTYLLERLVAIILLATQR
jgi:hypothetical protein